MRDYLHMLGGILGNTTYQERGAEAAVVYGEAQIGALASLFLEKRSESATIYFVGNGGSAGIAVHMAADFQKTGNFKTQTFYDPSLLTCMANDYGYEQVFSKPLALFAKNGDVLVAISSSGKSANILNAADTAKTRGCGVITFTGFAPDNPLRARGDINIHVPSFDYGIVESIHNLMLQELIDVIAGRDR